MRKVLAVVFVALISVGAWLGGMRPASALTDEQEIVEKARITAMKLLTDPNYSGLQSALEGASGVIIFPSIIKGAFFIGGEGGTGILLARNEQGTWSYPAFYTLGAGSFGFQIGGQAAEVIFVIRKPGALEAVLKNQIKLGADVSFALGEIGGGVEGSTTTNLNADVIAFASAKGLFGGIALEGAVIAMRNSLNENYYGTGATPRAIVVEQKFFNAGADSLRQVLAAY